MKKTFQIILFIILFPLLTFAAGETGLAVLKIGVGARAAAMGEAFTAVSNDASGFFWNPAGSAWITGRQAHFTHNEWIQDMTNDAASALFPVSKGVLGIGILLNNVNGFERRITATEEPLGDFSSHDFSIALSWSQKMGENFSAGISAKYLNEKIYVESASGFAVDFGATYQLLTNELFVAAVIQNIGSMSEMVQESIALPKTYKAGLAWYVPCIAEKKLLIAADFVSILDDTQHFLAGFEYRPVSLIALRGGYGTGYDEKSFSAGFGLALNAFMLDYAWIPYSHDLGNAQRFSVSANF